MHVVNVCFEGVYVAETSKTMTREVRDIDTDLDLDYEEYDEQPHARSSRRKTTLLLSDDEDSNGKENTPVALDATLENQPAKKHKGYTPEELAKLTKLEKEIIILQLKKELLELEANAASRSSSRNYSQPFPSESPLSNPSSTHSQPSGRFKTAQNPWVTAMANPALSRKIHVRA
jgi:hypothetical protein